MATTFSGLFRGGRAGHFSTEPAMSETKILGKRATVDFVPQGISEAEWEVEARRWAMMRRRAVNEAHDNYVPAFEWRWSCQHCGYYKYVAPGNKQILSMAPGEPPMEHDCIMDFRERTPLADLYAYENWDTSEEDEAETDIDSEAETLVFDEEVPFDECGACKDGNVDPARAHWCDLVNEGPFPMPLHWMDQPLTPPKPVITLLPTPEYKVKVPPRFAARPIVSHGGAPCCTKNPVFCKRGEHAGPCVKSFR